jgi:hypothetical protein
MKLVSGSDNLLLADQFPAYQSRARARERQVFRARAESPNAAGGTSGLTDPLLKSKNYS